MRVMTIGYTQENVRCQLLTSVGRAQARQIRELVHKISKGENFYAPCTKSCTKFLLFKFCSPLAKCVLLHLHNIPPSIGGVMVGIEVHYVFPYIEERVCVGLRKIFPLSMEVYFCDFGFETSHKKIYM